MENHDTVQPTQEVQEQPIEQVPQESPQEVQAAPKGNQENIRLLRQKAEKAERVERERDEAIRKLNELQSKAVIEPDEEIDLKPDDLAEGKHLTKMQRKIKKLEEKIRVYEQSSQELSVESKIRNNFPDFDKIVTTENVELLKNAYPELATALNASSDLYSKAASAYTLIKKFGIAKDEPYEEDKERAIANAHKPRPLASVSPQQGDSPLSRANAFANGLTDELKAKLLKEMNESRKGY